MSNAKDLGLCNDKIISIVRTEGTGAPGTVDTYTVTLRSGSTYNFYVTNGSNYDASPKGIYSTLSDLETAFPTGNNNIYIVSANGHWYYWSGSAWTDGGIYQATGYTDDVFISIYKKDLTTYGSNLVSNATLSLTHSDYDYVYSYTKASGNGYFGRGILLGTYGEIKNKKIVVNVKSLGGIPSLDLFVCKNSYNWSAEYGNITVIKEGTYILEPTNSNLNDTDNVYVYIRNENNYSSNYSGDIALNIGYADKTFNASINSLLLNGKTIDEVLLYNFSEDYYFETFEMESNASITSSQKGIEYNIAFTKNSGAGYFASEIRLGKYKDLKNKKIMVNVKSLGGLPSIELVPCSTYYNWSGEYNQVFVNKEGYYTVDLTNSSIADETDIRLFVRNEQNYNQNYNGTIKLNISKVDIIPTLNAITLNGYTSDDFLKSEIKTDVIFWGDSLTAGAGGNGTTYPNVVASLLNCSVINGGVGGETSKTIALRQGGLKGLIPDGNGQNFDIINANYNNGDFAPLKQGAGYLNPIVIDGNEYTLTKNNDDTYSISGYSTNIVKPFKTYGSTLKGKITVIWVGTNDNIIDDDVISTIDSMISVCGNDKYIVMGLTMDNDDTDYDKLIKHFGSHFFNTRKEVISNWVAITGLTPTSSDYERISENKVPSSLLSDTVHFNSYGYIVIGTMLSYRIKEMLK